MVSGRMAKVNALIETELSGVLTKILPGSSMLATITSVETTADLSEAKVWVSILPDTEEAWQAVTESHGRLQSHLASRLRLKRIPKLHLHQDRSARHVERINDLLDADDT